MVYMHVLYSITIISCRYEKWTSEKPEYFQDNPDLPIFERISTTRKRLYSVEDVTRILLSPSLRSSDFVCTKVPITVNENIAFIVNLDKLDDRKDVLSDDMGVWKHNGVDTSHVRVSFTMSEVESVQKFHPSTASDTSTYTVKRVYRTHTTDKTLKKLTAYIHGKTCDFFVVNIA